MVFPNWEWMALTRARLRPATFSDIPALADLLEATHGRSRLHALPFSETRAKALLMQAAQRHGGTAEGATFLAVAEREGRIEGFILGTLTAYYHVLDALEATDLFWITDPKAHPWTAARLLRAFHRWADANEKVVVIRQGVTDVVSGEPERVEPLMRRRGMQVSGAIYERGH